MAACCFVLGTIFGIVLGKVMFTPAQPSTMPEGNAELATDEPIRLETCTVCKKIHFAHNMDDLFHGVCKRCVIPIAIRGQK